MYCCFLSSVCFYFRDFLISTWHVIKQFDFLIAIGLTWWIAEVNYKRAQVKKYIQNIRLLWDEAFLTNADPEPYNENSEAIMFAQPYKNLAIENLICNHFDELAKDEELLRTVSNFQIALLNYNSYIPLNNEITFSAGIKKNKKLKKKMFTNSEDFRRQVNASKYNLIGVLYIKHATLLGADYLERYFKMLPQSARDNLEKLRKTQVDIAKRRKFKSKD